MVGGVVNHDNCSLPPLSVDRVKVVAQLNEEEAKGATVVLATVDGVHQPAVTAHCCYDAEGSQTLHGSHHIGLTWPAPAMLPLICLVQHTLINVDNSLSLDHVLNVVSSSQLPLQLSLLLVVSIIDGLDFLVGEAQLIFEIAVDHPRAEPQLDF